MGLGAGAHPNGAPYFAPFFIVSYRCLFAGLGLKQVLSQSPLARLSITSPERGVWSSDARATSSSLSVLRRVMGRRNPGQCSVLE